MEYWKRLLCWQHFPHFDYLGISNAFIWLFCIGVIAYQLAKRYAITLAIPFFLIGMSALWRFRNALNGNPIDVIWLQLDLASLSAIASLFLTLLVASTFTIKKWICFFRWIAIANAFFILIDFIFRIHEVTWGVLFNASMSGCFCAVLFPLFWEDKKPWKLLFVLSSATLTARSQPMAIIFSSLAAATLYHREFKWFLYITPFPFILGWVLKGKELFNSNERTFIWKEAIHYFNNNHLWWKGLGLGSFFSAGPYLSRNFYLSFTWLHSDWLQVWFECGWFTLIAVAVMWLHALWKARRNLVLFMALMGFAMWAGANMPLRYPLCGLYGAVLLRWAFEKRYIYADDCTIYINGNELK